jgi:hypothetical protein
VRRLALFLSGVLAGIITCYVAAIAAVWRHFTRSHT